jgi:hypothetical protein
VSFLSIVGLWFVGRHEDATNLHVETGLPKALKFFDSGLVPVTIDKGYKVGDTYLIPTKALLYSADACFAGDLVVRRGKTTFALDLVYDTAITIFRRRLKSST